MVKIYCLTFFRKKRVEKSYVSQKEKKTINKNNLIGCKVLRNGDKKKKNIYEINLLLLVLWLLASIF